MHQTASDNEIKANIKTLSHGLMQSDYSVAYGGYRKLYEIGTPAIPPLKDIILGIDWSNKKYKELSRYVAGLFSLIHDIDETEANHIKSTLTKNGCPAHIQSLMKSKCSFSTKNYHQHKICGVDVYESKKINKRCDIPKYIESWLMNIPTDDLNQITRLYIVSKEGIKESAAGTYTPGLFKVVLLWDNRFKEHSFLFKLFSMMTEKVLYHEIGHHVNRHTFGQIPEQEKEADAYAAKILRREHPNMYWLSRSLSKVGIKCEKDYYKQEYN